MGERKVPTDADVEAQTREYEERVAAGANPQYRCWQIEARRMMENPDGTTIRIFDPRAEDYPEDSELWGLLMAWSVGEQLLNWQFDRDSVLCGLRAARAGGARLVRQGDALRITRGEWSEEEYAEIRRRFFEPQAIFLRRLLQRLGVWMQEREFAKGAEAGSLAQAALL